MIRNRLFLCSLIVGLLAISIAMTFGFGCGGQNSSGCQDNVDCAEAEYCQKEEGDCNGEGVCLPVPDILCPDVWDPVCGCDGITYGNNCEALAVGANIAFEGECPPLVCSQDSDCLETEYCEKAPGDCSGDGVCSPVFTGGCPEVWDPVCGCDGNTYANACYALLAGVNVASEGECPLPPPSACTQNSECGETEYCQKDPGACDDDGVCASRAEGCPLLYDPVCGCDGSTYGNACYAAAAGVNVAHAGECVPD